MSVLVDDETAAGRLCELMDGTVLTPGELTRYLDRAWMERLVFSGRNRVIEVGGRGHVVGHVRKPSSVATWPHSSWSAPAGSCTRRPQAAS